MLVPVSEELLHERSRAVGVVLPPGRRIDLEVGEQVAGLLAEREDRLVQIREVLVEGGRLEAHVLGDVGEAQTAQSPLLDRCADGFEDALARADPALAEGLPVGGGRGGAHGRTLRGRAACPVS